MRLYYLTLSVVSICLWSCANTDFVPENIEAGDSYFDVAIGEWWEYEVDSFSVRLDFNGERVLDSSRSWMRWEIVSVEQVGEDTIFLIELSRKKVATEEYRVTETWSLETNGHRWLRRQGGLVFEIAELPVFDFRIWSGNRFIDDGFRYTQGIQNLIPYGDWNYRYDSDRVNAIIGGEELELLRVTHVDRDDLIGLRQVSERYAKGVGLVSRVERIFDTQCVGVGNGDITLCSGLPWRQKADLGWISSWRLVNWR